MAIVRIFSNGTSGVWDDKGNQSEEIESWLKVYLRELVSRGIDPVKADIQIDGRKITVFHTYDPDTGVTGFNWQL